MSNKNYLFKPFKDDDDKINAFGELKDTLRSYIDESNIDINLVYNPLIMFMGQIESYYDCMLNELKAVNERLNTECWCGCNDDLKAEYTELKTENKRLHDHISHLKREREKMRSDIKHDADVSYELDDTHVEIIKRLESDNALMQVEVESLQDQLKECVHDYDLLLDSHQVK